METTYTLRENLTWQDGAPLTAEDFAFAFRVYTDPGLGVFVSTPQDAMEAVLAPDPRTVVVQWRSPNPVGGNLGFEDLDPLPRHLLEPLFNEYAQGRSSGEAFMADALWTASYIGAGPYRLEHWEPGVQLEGAAFAAHALGQPKINRIVVRIFIDENQTLAAVLAGGQIDYACCNTLRFGQFVTLKREWETARKGTAATIPGTAVFLYLQQRPEYVGHEAQRDLRVRRALAHAVDRQAINEGLFDGLGAPTESPVPPNLPYFPGVDRSMTKYPLDLNRATQLMGEAGFTREGGGMFADRQGRRFHIDFAVQGASEIERMQAILSDSWRQAGFEVHQEVIAPQVYSQLETRHTLPGLGYAFFQGEDGFLSNEVGTAANRWRGRNRTGWTSSEYDRLWEGWRSELDRGERGRHVAQMMALVSENLPGYALYFSQGVIAWVSELKGPSAKEASKFGRTSEATTAYWDVHEWSF
jgi:peptide/nickel transport system substrate-binding protein